MSWLSVSSLNSIELKTALYFLLIMLLGFGLGFFK